MLKVLVDLGIETDALVEIELEVEEFVELKVYRVGSNSRCIGRGTGKGSGRIKSRIEVLVIEEVFMLDCSKNVEVLVGLVLSSILFRP